MKATWNNIVLAESDDTIVVEGNHYFPPEALHKEYFKTSAKHTTCPWKGEASYYTCWQTAMRILMQPGFILLPKKLQQKLKII